MITAMLFAGGSGVRMESSDLPKQFLEVGGKPIIWWTRSWSPAKATGSATSRI